MNSEHIASHPHDWQIRVVDRIHDRSVGTEYELKAIIIIYYAFLIP